VLAWDDSGFCRRVSLHDGVWARWEQIFPGHIRKIDDLHRVLWYTGHAAARAYLCDFATLREGFLFDLIRPARYSMAFRVENIDMIE